MRWLATATAAWLVSGCSFDGPAQTAALVDAAPDARWPACASDPGYQIHPVTGVRLAVFSDNLDFTMARAACAAGEARLAILDTPDKVSFASSLTSADRTWIGMTELAIDEWEWIDGSPVVLTRPPWGQGKPDGGQGCGALRDDGDFDDEGCGGGRDHLCECPLPRGLRRGGSPGSPPARPARPW